MAEPYRDDIDFAFFVVNFGYSRSDYDDLTQSQKLLIMKAWEDKRLLDTTLMNKAVLNAGVNLRKRKGGGLIPLWEKDAVKEITEEQKTMIQDHLKRIEASKDDKSWVKKIYEANSR